MRQSLGANPILFSILFAAFLPAGGWAQAPSQVKGITTIIAEQKARDAETAAGIASNGQLLYDADARKGSWDEYCRSSQTLADQGEFRRAIREASKALHLGQSTGNNTALAYATRDLAYAYNFAGDLDKAQAWAEQSLEYTKAIYSDRFDKRNTLVAPDEKILGDVASRRGQYDEARRRYEAALSASGFFSNHKTHIRLSIASVEARLGHWAAAREIFVREVGSSDDSIAALARRSLAEVALGEGKTDEALALFRKASEAARAAKSDYLEMWAAFGLARAHQRAGDDKAASRSLDEALQLMERLRGRFRAEEFKSGFFSESQSILDFAVAASAKAGDAARALEVSEQSRARAAVDLLRERTATARQSVYVPARQKPGAIAAALPDKVVAVVYHVLPETTVAWTVRRDGTAMKSIAAGAKSLEAAVLRWRGSITSGDENLARQQSSTLHSLLLGSLELRDGETIIFIPHKSLHLAPMHALRGPKGAVIESHPVAYALSLSALGETLARPPASSPGVLAMGNPDLADPQLDLPGAEDEVRYVAKLLEGQPFVRGEASAARFRSQATSAGLVHVAAHATVDEVDPLFSTLKLSGGDIEAREVYDMSLGSANLVTLSACSSGLGKVAGGDEFWGFKRSFLVAGARSLLVSLWPVADDASSRLMQSFYKHRQSTGAAHALQAAQLELLRDARDGATLFWAPFVLVGDWR